MKLARGVRPWTIKFFAVSFVGAALLRLVEGLLNIPNAGWRLANWLGPLATSEDAVIVALSTEFTIALIPVFWIYFLGSSFARWVVLGFGLYKLFSFRILLDFAMTSLLFSPVIYIEPLLIAVALIMLFLPASRRWLSQAEEADPETFA